MKIGSLFSGYGGLDRACEEVFDAKTAWYCEIEPKAAETMSRHWPDAVNHGDVTQVDWSQVEPVDILTGGFPCQDVSLAGKQAGMVTGSRSGLWAEFLHAITVLRPKFVVIENVKGLLSASAGHVGPRPGVLGDEFRLRALGVVLGQLSEIGYDAGWETVSATEAGLAHRRERVFILAYPQGTGLEG